MPNLRHIEFSLALCLLPAGSLFRSSAKVSQELKPGDCGRLHALRATVVLQALTHSP